MFVNRIDWEKLLVHINEVWTLNENLYIHNECFIMEMLNFNYILRGFSFSMSQLSDYINDEVVVVVFMFTSTMHMNKNIFEKYKWNIS